MNNPLKLTELHVVLIKTKEVLLKCCSHRRHNCIDVFVLENSEFLQRFSNGKQKSKAQLQALYEVKEMSKGYSSNIGFRLQWYERADTAGVQ